MLHNQLRVGYDNLEAWHYSYSQTGYLLETRYETIQDGDLIQAPFRLY